MKRNLITTLSILSATLILTNCGGGSGSTAKTTVQTATVVSAPLHSGYFIDDISVIPIESTPNSRSLSKQKTYLLNRCFDDAT